MKTKYVIELTQTYAVKMAEQHEETQDDSHAEDWSSDRSSEDWNIFSRYNSKDIEEYSCR